MRRLTTGDNMIKEWNDWTGLNEVFEVNGPDGAWCEVVEHNPLFGRGEENAFYGEKHTEETKAQMRASASRRGETDYAKRQRCANAKKTWTFISPNNTIVRFKGSLKFFCEQRGLNFGRMAQVHKLAPRCKSHKGWRGIDA